MSEETAVKIEDEEYCDHAPTGGSGEDGIPDTAKHYIAELEGGSVASRLNWLRAGVLGANDGIISTAGLVMGVAGAASSRTALLVAGLAGMVAGALSMAGGEYVSVSTQRDTENAVLAKEAAELRDSPDEELEELAYLYRQKGLSTELSRQVAAELTAHDALAAHAEAELGISATERTSPIAAALASLFSFALGASVPLLLMVLSSDSGRVLATLIGVVAALSLTGFVSARLGGSRPTRPVLRNIAVGLAAMGVTYGVGYLVGLLI